MYDRPRLDYIGRNFFAAIDKILEIYVGELIKK